MRVIPFTFLSGDEDFRMDFCWSDDYFADSSYFYNQSLATASLAFAMSGFGAGEGGTTNYMYKSQNARDFMMSIGINPETIETNEWFTEKPTADSIGAVAGNMQIKSGGEKFTLIACTVRGAGYESEWASNFTIGSEGNHNGFDTASENVFAFLKEYVQKQGISGNVKIWMAGFSRAAATVNLLAGKIDTALAGGENPFGDNVRMTLGDTFAFCFETPSGVLKENTDSVIYNNIFNIINPNDPVTMVAPAGLGFCRYGIDLFLPSQETFTNYATFRDNMLKEFDPIPGKLNEKYIVDDFEMKEISIGLTGGLSIVNKDNSKNYSQSVFLSKYMSVLTKDFIISRENYVKNLQDEVREICRVGFGCSDEQREIMVDSLLRQAKSGWASLAGKYLWSRLKNDKANATGEISVWLNKAVAEAGITDISKETIDSAGKKLGNLVMDLTLHNKNMTTTAIMNIKTLGAAHNPELCMAWMRSMDKNYNPSAEEHFTDGIFREVKVHGNANIAVYNSNHTLVAKTKKNDIVELGSTIRCSIDDDRNKFVYLPANADFSLEITATQDTTADVVISEYVPKDGNYNEVKKYSGIKLSSGQSEMLEIPQHENNQTAEKCIVEILPTSASLGKTTGAGKYDFGAITTLSATECDRGTFAGWFNGDKRLSKDADYRLCIIDNMTLEARFEERVKLGDLTEDDKIDNADAVYMIRYLLNPPDYKLNQRSDFNTNNIVDINDALLVMKHAASPTEYKISEFL